MTMDTRLRVKAVPEAKVDVIDRSHLKWQREQDRLGGRCTEKTWGWNGDLEKPISEYPSKEITEKESSSYA